MARFDRTSTPKGFVIALHSEPSEETVGLGMESFWGPAHTVAHELAKALRIPARGLALEPDDPIQPHSTVRASEKALDLASATSEQLAALWLYNVLGAAALAGLSECHVLVRATDALMVVPENGILGDGMMFRDDGWCVISERPGLPPDGRVAMIAKPVAQAFSKALKEACGMDATVSDRLQNGAVRVESSGVSCNIQVICSPNAAFEHFVLSLQAGAAEIDTDER